MAMDESYNETMQDYDDSFLDRDHPLYYENNPDELDNEDYETIRSPRAKKQPSPQNSGCIILLGLILFLVLGSGYYFTLL